MGTGDLLTFKSPKSSTNEVLRNQGNQLLKAFKLIRIFRQSGFRSERFIFKV